MTSGGHNIHAAIHEAYKIPYTTFRSGTRQANHLYFNADAWTTYVDYNMPIIETKDPAGLFEDLIQERGPGFPPESGEGRFFRNWFTQRSEGTFWNGSTWYTTPFGACYKVWSDVGADPVGTSINNSWVLSTQSGMVGVADAVIHIPYGWSAVYFPVIKMFGGFPAGTQIMIHWIRPSDGLNHFQGWMDMRDFSDSAVFTVHDDYYNTDHDQTVYSAMVYPVLCRTLNADGKDIKIRLYRNISGPGIFLGRPIVIPEGCTWFTEQ